MVEYSAPSRETYDVSFDGFPFMTTFSSSARLSLIGIGTSVLIALLMRGRSTRLVLYNKDAYLVEHSLVNVTVLSCADIPSDSFPAIPLSNTCREILDKSQYLYDNLIVVCR